MEPWLERAARPAPEPDRGRGARTAVATYAELLDRARRVALRPCARGRPRGDRAARRASTSSSRCTPACCVGAAAMPVDLGCEPARDACGGAPLVDEPLERGEPAAARRPHEDDVALVVHTSGTTGEPRPVELTYGNVLANALGSAVALGLDRDERWLCPLPLSHVGGLMVLLRSAIYAHHRACIGAAGDARRRHARLAGADPARPPARRGRRPPRCARCCSAARRRPALLTRAARPAGRSRRRTASPQACSPVDHRRARRHRDRRPRAPRRRRLDRAPTARSSSTAPTVAGGGTLRTGDLGRLDDRGRLIVIGRKADTIVSGGENVAPAEVEAVLLEHPAVAEAGVFAPAAPGVGRGGHRPCGAARRTPPRTSCAHWAGERLARFKVPKAIEVADALPRTTSGKLLRRELA